MPKDKLEELKFELEKQKAIFEYWKNREYNITWISIGYFVTLIIISFELLKSGIIKLWGFIIIFFVIIPICGYYIKEQLSYSRGKQLLIKNNIEKLKLK